MSMNTTERAIAIVHMASGQKLIGTYLKGHIWGVAKLNDDRYVKSVYLDTSDMPQDMTLEEYSNEIRHENH